MSFEITPALIQRASDDFMGRWYVESMIRSHYVTTLAEIKRDYPHSFNRAMGEALREFMKDPAVVEYLGDPKIELIMPEKMGRAFLGTLLEALAHREPAAPHTVYESLRCCATSHHLGGSDPQNPWHGFVRT